MAPSLDDVERERWARSPLYGDRWVEYHATLRPQRAAAIAGTGRVDGRATETVSLDGEWLLAGAEPAREFSIDRWTGDESDAVRREPVGWHRDDTDRSTWVRATVPGTVQGALVAAGVMADPLLHDHTYAELNEYGTPSEWPWFFRRTRLEQQEWWYARRFSVPAHWRGRGIRLSFDGVDYMASVYLNGQPVARHVGMYGGPDIDITALVRWNAENEVVVRIDPPPRDWHGIMKPSPGWGWHYGHLISMGIWRGVRLEAVPEVELADPFADTMEVTDASARVRVQWDVIRHDETEGRLALDVTVQDARGAVAATARVEVDTRPGTTRHDLEIEIPDPRVWWPRGYGEQPLYTVEVSTQDHLVSAAFGIRTIRMQPLPDRHGPDTYDWQVVVNGRPLFLKGANWCWTDPMARRGFETDRHILGLVARANLQMLRAWGGGTIESDEFYAECDRLGILVLQEFPLTFGLDSTGADLTTIDEQTSRIVRRLRNHPSLAMWGGGNENPGTITSDDLLTIIGRRVTQYDPSRPFHRTDPWGGSEHYYGVYHEGLPVEAYLDYLPTVFGEYGLSSQCDISSMRRFLDPALLEQWPPPAHGAIVQHQAQFSLFDLFKQARYAAYGPIQDWATFSEYSQLAQGDALRFASERMRAHSGTKTSAYWFYKVGEAFPGASWAVVDYYGVPKLSYYRALQFSAPRAAYAVYDRTEWSPGEIFRAGIHVSNDSPAALRGARLAVRLHDARLRVIASRDQLVDLDADARLDAFELAEDLAGVEVEPLVLSVELTDAAGVHLSSAWYPFNHQPKDAALRELEREPLESLMDRAIDELLAPYADLRSPLRELPRTRLEARLDGAELVVRNIGGVAAPLVLIDGFPHGLGRALGDNAFGLAAGAERRIAIETGDAALDGLTVRAWNADAVPVR